MEYDQMRFTFQHSTFCGPHISYIGVAVHGSHQSKKSSTVDMTYELLPNPSKQAGCNTRSNFKQSLTDLNSEYSFL